MKGGRGGCGWGDILYYSGILYGKFLLCKLYLGVKELSIKEVKFFIVKVINEMYL